MEIGKEKEPKFESGEEQEAPREKIKQEKIPAPTEIPLESLGEPGRAEAEEGEIERIPKKTAKACIEKGEIDTEKYMAAIGEVAREINAKSGGKNKLKMNLLEETVKYLAGNEEKVTKSFVTENLMNQMRQEENRNL